VHFSGIFRDSGPGTVVEVVVLSASEALPAGPVLHGVFYCPLTTCVTDEETPGWSGWVAGRDHTASNWQSLLLNLGIERESDLTNINLICDQIRFFFKASLRTNKYFRENCFHLKGTNSDDTNSEIVLTQARNLQLFLNEKLE